MPIQFACPQCDKLLKVRDEIAGKKVRCPGCSATIAVPIANEASDIAELADDQSLGQSLGMRPGPAPRRSSPPPVPAKDAPPTRKNPAKPAAKRPAARSQSTLFDDVEREVSPRRRSTSLLVWILGGSAVAVLLLASLGIGLYFALSRGENGDIAGLPNPLDAFAKNDDGQPARPAVPAIKPPEFAGAKLVKELPDTIGDVAVGGGGRYLFFHLPQQRKIAMFDVSEAKVAHYFPAGDDSVHFAAGATKLVVILGTTNIIHRWNLATKEREVAAPSPVAGVVKTITMGSASEGPLLVYWAHGTDQLAQAPVDFVDVATLKVLPFNDRQGGGRHHVFRDRMHYRASSNGQVFGAWATSHSPSGVHSLVVTGGQIKGHYQHDSRGHVVPGPDGKNIYTAGGILSSELKAFGNEQRGGAALALPAVQGDYYLRLTPQGDRFGGPDKGVKMQTTVHLSGDNRPLATLPELDLTMGNENWAANNFTFDKRVIFIPEAKLVVAIPATNRQVVLHRFDVDEALEKSGIDYLLVTSRPPAVAAPGKTLTYQMVVKSKQGNVKCRLESGPQGMAVSTGGKVTWAVRADERGEQNVIVSVSDKSGQEVFHTFKINVQNNAAVVAEAPVKGGNNPAPKFDPPVVKKVEEKRVEPRDWVEKVENGPKVAPRPVFDPDEPLAKPAPAGIEFALPPQPARLMVSPPKLESPKVTRALPDTIHDVTLAGGGRFIIAHLPKLRQLAVFDANEGKVVKFLPVAGDRVFLAGGMNKLIVALPDTDIIQRWNLLTFEREVSAAMPVPGKIKGMAMGHASAGPLLISVGPDDFRSELAFIDIATMRRLDLPRPVNGNGPRDNNGRIRASADGRTFAMPNAGISEAVILNLSASGAAISNADSGALVPGPDGKLIFGMNGLFNAQGKRQGANDAAGRNGRWTVPAVQGNYYLSVPYGNFHPQIASDKRFAPISVHINGDARPLATLAEVNGDFRDTFSSARTLPVDLRYHFIPEAKLLVTIPPQADKIEVHRLDIDESLEKSGIDYLFVASTPPGYAVPGKDYRYDVQVRSKKGGVTYKVETGPEGMKVSPAGVVTWKVAPDQAKGETNAILTVGDKSGQELFHTFSVAVVDKAPIEAAVIDKTPVGPNKKTPEPKIAPEPEPVVKIPAKFAPDAGAIKPPTFAGEQVIRDLPAACDDIAVGGGGRYILFNLPSLRKIAVFDVNEAKVVHYFPVSSDNVRFAAGLTKVVIAYPDTRIIQRWSLGTFERDLSVPLEIDNVQGLYLGSASEGPLLIPTGDRFRGGATFLDLKSLKPIAIAQNQPGGRGFSNNIRVSADGTVFGTWASGSSPSGLQSYVLTGNTLKGHYEHTSVGHICPGPDGRTLYTASGLYTNEVKALHQGGRNGDGRWTIPALHGDYYLAQAGGGRGAPQAKEKPSLTVHLAGDARPLVTIPYEHGPFDRFGREKLGTDRRILFVPAANVILFVLPTNDKIVVQRLDIDAAMETSGIDFLFVTSRPTPRAVLGGDYIYAVQTKSKKGSVKYRLESSPDGMRVTPAGVVVWKTPNLFPEGQVDVILTVTDASGQEVFHTFKIAVVKEPLENLKGAANEIPVEKAPVAPPKQEAVKIDPKPVVDPPAAKGPPARALVSSALKVAPLKADMEERMLPSAIADTCVGGGGRFFILHLPKERKLAVFDVNEAKIVKFISLADDNVRFAASLEKLFVVSADKNIIQRFSLATFEKELTVPLPFPGSVKTLATGSAAAGPLLIFAAQNDDRGSPVAFLDPVSFKEILFAGNLPSHSARDAYHYRASPDGSVFGGWVSVHSQSMSSIVLSGNTAKTHNGEMAGIVVPATDNTLVTAGGLYTSECKRIGADKENPRYKLRVPSQTGRFYITCPGGGGAQFNTGMMDTGKPTTVYLIGDARPLATLANVELPASNEAWTNSDFTQDKRIFFVPEAKLLAVVPKSSDRLILHRVDIDAALEKSGIDYLYVVSRPPTSARKGASFTYAPQVKSKKGGLAFRLESGPEGMKAATDGALTWPVPRDFADPEINIILSIADATGQEIFHTFRVAVKDGE